ncbi:MAG: hypothetical protein IKJ34_01980 [Mailhella sp.]|nr:hypothetical protein [Mailhella sp.]
MALPYALEMIERLFSKFDSNTGQLNADWVPDMQGATEHSVGKHGLVPAPTQEEVNRPLGGSGEWLKSADIDITGIAEQARCDDEGNVISETYATLDDILPDQDPTELFNKALSGE